MTQIMIAQNNVHAYEPCRYHKKSHRNMKQYMATTSKLYKIGFPPARLINLKHNGSTNGKGRTMRNLI